MSDSQTANLSNTIKTAGIVTLVFSQILVFSGAFMKIQHYPFTSRVLFSGECLVVIAVGLFLLLLLKKSRKFEDN